MSPETTEYKDGDAVLFGDQLYKALRVDPDAKTLQVVDPDGAVLPFAFSFQDSNLRKIDLPQSQEVLVGVDSSDGAPPVCNLLRTGATHRLPHSTVFIGSDRGIPKQDKQGPNEDRACVSPETGWAFAIDGMGGYGGGDVAATILGYDLSHELKEGSSRDLDRVLGFSGNRLQEALLHAPEQVDLKAGAVFAGCRILPHPEDFNKRIAQVVSRGDCRVTLVRNGQAFSLTTPDENSITKNPTKVWPLHNNEPLKVNEWEVMPGDIILAYTDGIGNCFTPEQIVSYFVGRSMEAGIALLDAAVLMQMQLGHFDNRGLAAVLVE
ncbi:MAG: hypothetical protein WCW30_01125 [Candidatus Gracilibacteria bacterium]